MDGDWRLVSFVMIGAYLSSKEDKVELYATRREPSDFGGSVISAEDFGTTGQLSRIRIMSSLIRPWAESHTAVDNNSADKEYQNNKTKLAIMIYYI